jgi:hypothetical protein
MLIDSAAVHAPFSPAPAFVRSRTVLKGQRVAKIPVHIDFDPARIRLLGATVALRLL